MHHLFPIAAAALLWSAATAYADPVGRYLVHGTNPGSREIGTEFGNANKA